MVATYNFGSVYNISEMIALDSGVVKTHTFLHRGFLTDSLYYHRETIKSN